MTDKKPKKALHRGLKALISDEALEIYDRDNVSREKGPANMPGLFNVPVGEIAANPFQPREDFNLEELEELKSSISKHGVLEPVILRRSKGQYELVSGERRLRAVRSLGFKEIPAIVRDRVSDREMQILSLVENQQRSDLNDLEVALGYNELISQFNYTHDKVAEDTGKSRSFVSNTLRLLKLPDEIKQALMEGKISAGHARALLSLEQDRERLLLLERILKEGLNVRQVEKMVSGEKADKPPKSGKQSLHPDLAELQNRLNHHFGTRVDLLSREGKGKLVIHFTDTTDLNRITDILKINEA